MLMVNSKYKQYTQHTHTHVHTNKHLHVYFTLYIIYCLINEWLRLEVTGSSATTTKLSLKPKGERNVKNCNEPLLKSLLCNILKHANNVDK